MYLGELVAVFGVVGEIVDEDNLLDEMFGAAVEDGDDGPQQRRPRLVVEGDDDARLGQRRRLPVHVAAIAVTRVRNRPVRRQFIRLDLIEFVGGIRVAAIAHQSLGDVPDR